EKKLKIAKNLLQNNDSLSLDEDEIAKIKDEESQKSAKKWLKIILRTYVIVCRDNPSQKNNSYFNMLDGHEKFICSKLSTLLVEISNIFIGYRESLYKLVIESHKCISKITILEEYVLTDISESECELLTEFRNTLYRAIGLEIARLQALSITHGSKKDDPSGIDIIDLYC
ncbi:21006_t:CDS:2, partial [Gigaspora rosea]